MSLPSLCSFHIHSLQRMTPALTSDTIDYCCLFLILFQWHYTLCTFMSVWFQWTWSLWGFSLRVLIPCICECSLLNFIALLQGFPTAPPAFWARWFMVAEAVLCCVGFSGILGFYPPEASALPHPSCDDQKCLLALLNVRGQNYLAESHCSVVLHCVYIPQSSLLLMDSWVVSSLGLLKIVLLWTFLRLSILYFSSITYL